MYDAMITIGGFVGTDVDFKDGTGTAYATFRLASTPRRYDKSSHSWHDLDPVWYSVKTWRGLAHNVKASVRQGDALLVYGRLRTNRWRDGTGQEQFRTVIEATAIGHDLNLGTSAYRRNERPSAHRHDPDANDLVTDVAAQAGAA